MTVFQPQSSEEKVRQDFEMLTECLWFLYRANQGLNPFTKSTGTKVSSTPRQTAVSKLCVQKPLPEMESGFLLSKA